MVLIAYPDAQHPPRGRLAPHCNFRAVVQPSVAATSTVHLAPVDQPAHFRHT